METETNYEGRENVNIPPVPACAFLPSTTCYFLNGILRTINPATMTSFLFEPTDIHTHSYMHTIGNDNNLCINNNNNVHRKVTILIVTH
jgi:hypothetical protein